MKTKSLRKPDVRVRSMVLAVAACFVTANSMALPVGPQVVNGTATISQVGNTLNVTNSNGAILNWQNFNIGANETTRFIQSSASSAVLNRVLAQDPSVILGNLTSNGKVWLINPSGILVGAGARIDTAAFVASTLNITNADFLANRMRFEAGSGQVGNVVNQGTITTPLGGAVYLVGANVSNDGLITTPKGETILAAGNTVELLDSATPGVKVEITGAVGNATNLGEIVAEAGRVGIAGVIVRNSGTLNASSVVEEGGKIFLRASKDAYVDGAGRIVTTGKTGGQVEVLGERVAVMDQARIDASGEDAGGKILVGGDWQGKNPDVRNAQVAYFGPAAELKVNATKVGAGGTAVVWADDTTRAYGRIEAKGVTRGGAVETSGKRYLDVNGARVDTSASSGTAGAWLLDPDEIQIYAGSGTDQLVNGAGWNNGVTGYLQAVGGYGTSVIYGATIGANLATSNVNLVTSPGGYGGTGNITFNPGVYDYSAYGNNLSVFAYGGGSYSGNISFDNAVLKLGSTAGGNGSAPDANRQVNLFAGWTGSGQYVNIGYGSISLVNNSRIEAKKVYALAGSNLAIEYGSGIHGIYGSPDAISLQSYGHIDVYGGIKSYGGDVLLWASSGVTIGNGYSYGGVGINARRDGLDGNTQTADEAGNGGRILIQADQDANGYGSFILNYGGMVATTNQSHLIDSNGVLGSSGVMAIGIIAANVSISYGGTIKLNGNATTTAGAPYGGGDIGFLSTYGSTIRVGDAGNYFGSDFMLDNTELSRILMPAAGASNCGTGQEGCRIWIGNISALSDPLVGALPATSQNIIVDRADFTKNGTTTVPKRVHLSTTGTVNDAGTGVYGSSGYFGIKAGHISAYGGAGVGKSDADGLSFIANSVSLMAAYGSMANTITATSVGGGTLALRRANAGGAINLDVLGGGVTLLPYFTGQTESTPGSFALTADGDIGFAKSGINYILNTPFGGSFQETAPSTTTIRAGGNLALASRNGSITIVGDHAATGGISVHATNGGIFITDGGLTTAGSLGMMAGGDITLRGVSRGVIIKSVADMTLDAANIHAYGGDAVNAGAPGSGAVYAFYGANGQQDVSGYGAGVAISTLGNQFIHANNTNGLILLQAGSANNTNTYGSSVYGGSVEFRSNGTQTVSANKIQLRAGATGHDNRAIIGAQGAQNLTITGSNGELLIQGGGGADSFNNNAELTNWYGGAQTVTTYGGGLVTLRAGNGTGLLGGWYEYGGSYISEQSGNNTARISNYNNNGGGALLIDFYGGGTLALYGGGAGTGNSAEVGGHSVEVTSSQGDVYFPNVIIQGGSAGGAERVLRTSDQKYHSRSNDAGIWSNDHNINGSVVLDVHHLTINGGSADYGGAGVGSYDLVINATGNVMLYGGTSSTVDTSEPYGKTTSAAYIGTDSDYGGGSILMNVGGDLYLKGGSGSSGPAIIGDLSNNPQITINAQGNVHLEAGAGSPVMIGSVGYGANIEINSGGNINLTGTSANAGVMIGSVHDSAAYGATVAISAARDLVATGYVQLGVVDPSGSAANTVELAAGYDGYYGMPSGYGGNLSLGTTGPVTINVGNYAGAEVNLGALSTTGSGTYGDIVIGAVSTIYGSGISVAAEGDSIIDGRLIARGLGVDLMSGWNWYDGIVSVGGGDIALGATSRVESYGGTVSSIANTGSGTNLGGAFTQSAGGAIYGGLVTIYAMGDAYLRGHIGAPTVAAAAMSPGNVAVHAGGNIGVATVTAYGATLEAGRAILDENGTATNLTAQHIFLSSTYGGSYGGLAISTDTASTGLIHATVGSTASYGGIFVRNSGPAPSSVTLTDSALAQSTANFTQYGDLIVGAGGTAVSLTAHDVALQSTGNMVLGSGGLNLNATYGSGSILIGADGNISLTSGFNLFKDVDIAVVSGGNFTATDGAYLHAQNLGIVAGGLLSVTYGAEVSAWDEVTLSGKSGIDFHNGRSHSGYSDIYLLTDGNIRLNDGTEIKAGNDAHLVLRGATSAFYLNETAAMAASKLVTDYATHDATTANINFTKRSSGGIVIDGATYTGGAAGKAGGSGIFVASANGLLIAEPGGGLSATNTGIAYTQALTPAVVPAVPQVPKDTISATDTATKSLSSTTTTAPPPPPAPTGPATSGPGGLLMPAAGGTIGGTEGSFGSSSASSTQTANASGSSSTSSANGQQESSQESKPSQKADEKKEEKKDEKKDGKKAEEKSEGKKDEKAASKKVSQCT